MQQGELSSCEHQVPVDDRRVRRGKIDGYLDYLDTSVIEFLKDQCAALLSSAAFQWMTELGVLRFRSKHELSA